ncbi:hypothetical protein BDQ17DRAFT_1361382 [Cyathus striatus]|nr:hypothetical protein BDQ17DRAFT_1361382 [Cyathus striatus]
MLFDILKREFCPPLDTSLLTALVADIETDAEGNLRSPSPVEISRLRATLKELAAQADSQVSDDLSELQLTDDTTTSVSQYTPDLYNGRTGTSCTTASTCESYNDTTSSSGSGSGSGSPPQPFSTPLGFLQAALPNVRTRTLKQGLKEAERSGGERDLDIWEVIAGILSKESIRELAERGLDVLEEDALLAARLNDEDIIWDEADKGKKASGSQPKKKQIRSTKIALNDVRQQHHIRPIPFKTSYATSRPAPDPWTQLSSMSSHLATLLPPHPESYFQSYFHSPKYATPYDSLCAALSALPSSVYEPDEPTLADEHTVQLFSLLDILLAEYDDLDAEQRFRLASDAELALMASQGRGEDALDLTKLLRELDIDTRAYGDMGIYHQPPSPILVKQQPVVRRPKLPSMPPVIPEPPQRTKSKSPPKVQKSKPPPNVWQTIPQKKPPSGPNPHASFIPVYSRNGRKVNGGGTALGNGELSELGAEYMRKRDELLREATRMWQKGNKKSRGGEVAFYFAERAREFQEMAMREKLNAAKVMVETKRLASAKQDTVDLHGTTVSEAIAIVKDTLCEFNSSQANPLKIITGRGSHSVNQVSVLKPAVKKALVEDGWNVGSWDGGLVIRGKR